MASVRERSPGHFEIRAYAGRDSDGRKVELHETYVHHRKDGGRREAERLGRKLQEQAEKLKRSPGTVGDLLERWLEHLEAMGRSPTTLPKYRRRARVLNDAIGSIRCGLLTIADVDRLWGELLRDGKSPSDVLAYRRVLSSALGTGERWGLVDRNVARLSSVPRADPADIVVPTPSQVRQLVEMAVGSRANYMAGAILVDAHTGLRRGELCALQFGDVEWDAQRIRVRRNAYRAAGGGSAVKLTKSYKERAFSVSEAVLEALDARRRQRETDAQLLGASGHVGPFIWAGDLVGQTPLPPDNINRNMTLLVTRAAKVDGEDWPYSFHSLRHFHATQLIGAGVDIRTVAERLGHSDPSTTLRIYAHFLPDRDRDAARVIAEALAPRDEVPGGTL